MLSSFLLNARRSSVSFLLTMLTVSAVQAQSSDTTFTRLLRKNQFGLTQTNGQFSGPGWNKIRGDIEKSALVLLGEGHGMAQVPVFTQAVARVLKPKVFVAEIDQYQAQDLSHLASQPGLPTAFSRQHPMALGFYSWQEEFELAQALRRQQVTFVGLEQVGGATAGRLLTRMAEESKSKAAKTALLARAARYQGRDRADMVAGTYERSTVSHLQPATLDSLRTLTRAESPAVRQMVENLALSSQIYQASNARPPGPHRMRINLMKRNLLAAMHPYDQPGQRLPNMLFKFGANHAGRGRSTWGDMYDVGNLAMNLADAHDQNTLHIFIIGKQGTQVAASNPDDFSQNSAPYSYADLDMVLPFMAATPAGAVWQVFDVRPLRRAMLYEGLKVATPEQQAVILGYDYVVIIPETTASHNF